MAAGPELACLFWPTVLAYFRIATHPAIFARPLAIEEAVGNVEQLLVRPHVRTSGEGDGFWARLRAVIDDARPSGTLVAEAHLVALMLEHDVRVVWSRDRHLRRFGGIDARDPFA